MQILTIVAVAAALASTAPGAAAPRRPAATVRAEATKLYRAGKYAAACPRFREAAKLAPDDPAIAADVGLCLMKLGDRGAAVTETLRAVRLARPGGPHDDPKTRRNAYYNLLVLGEKVDPPTNACGQLDAPEGCDRAIFACPYGVSSAGAQEGEDGEYASVALTAAAARPPCGEAGCVVKLPDYGDGDASLDEAPGRADVLLSLEHWMTGAAAAITGGELEPNTRCAIVLADACSRVVATACVDEPRGERVGRPEVGEVVLTPPQR